MDAALLSTVVVAVAGYVASFFIARYSSAQAFRQLLTQKQIERADDLTTLRVEECRRFIAAARLIRHSNLGEAAAMADLRRAAAGLELYAPDLVPEPLLPAVRATEDLVRHRAGTSWTDAVDEAEEVFDRTFAVLVDRMRGDLDVAGRVSARK